MVRRLIALVVLLSVMLAPVSASAQAPTVFKKVDFFIQRGDEVDDRDAQLIVDPRRGLILFAEEDDANQVFGVVEFNRITGVTYENSKHAQ